MIRLHHKIACLSLCTLIGCSPKNQIIGDFCDVVSPPVLAEDTPEHLVKNDRDLAKWIASIGLYGEQNCGWSR